MGIGGVAGSQPMSTSRDMEPNKNLGACRAGTTIRAIIPARQAINRLTKSIPSELSSMQDTRMNK
jgi:hypothetical protein